MLCSRLPCDPPRLAPGAGRGSHPALAEARTRPAARVVARLGLRYMWGAMLGLHLSPITSGWACGGQCREAIAGGMRKTDEKEHLRAHYEFCHRYPHVPTGWNLESINSSVRPSVCHPSVKYNLHVGTLLLHDATPLRQTQPSRGNTTSTRRDPPPFVKYSLHMTRPL